MRRATRALGWIVLGLLVLWAAYTPDARPGPGGRAQGLLGPFASLAASLQWTRVEADLRAGRFARAYARAETALALDPRAGAGWSFLADHLIYNRARPELEPDPAARRTFLRAGIALLARGEAQAEDPGRLAFEAGLALVHAAAYPDARRWPGGEAGAWEEAALHFERAAGLGHPLGAQAAARSRERAARVGAHAPHPGDD